MFGQYLVALFHARTAAHIMHLQATGPGSYAAHQALGAFYEGIVGLADGLAESYQGCYGLIKWPASWAKPASSAVSMLESLKEQSSECREEFADEPHLQNQIDEIVALIDSTLYKLKFLK